MAYGSYGVATARTTTELNLFWGGDRNKVGIIDAPARTYASTLVDAGNTPTSDIDAGLILAEDASNELVAWNADLAGATEVYGVCPVSFSTLDESGTAIDMDTVPPPILRAPLVAGSLSIQGAAFVGHADEFYARQQLVRRGCILDDDPGGYLTGTVDRTLAATGTTLSPTTAQNGMTFLCSAEGSTTVTLPTCQPGLIYTFIRLTSTANAAYTQGEFIVETAATADVMIGETADAATSDVDTLTYTTADEHNGSWVRVRGLYDFGITAPVAKWFVEYNSGNTAAFSVS